MSFEIGLMSVTFRQLNIEEVIATATSAGVTALSWTGDAHVPPGDTGAIDLARNASEAAGLRLEGYGAYWRAQDDDVEPWLDTAASLGASRVRIWAGGQGSADVTEADRAGVTDRIARAADQAAERGLTLALEFHLNTLTDTGESTARLLDEVAQRRQSPRPALQSYWQPRPGVGIDTAREELGILGDALAAVHVFSWDAQGTRYPLARNAEFWEQAIAALPAQDLPAELMLEFVKDESTAQFEQDVQSLREILQRLP